MFKNYYQKLVLLGISCLVLGTSLVQAATQQSITIRTNPTLKTGLVGHWTFDGKDTTTRIDDVSGNSNNGALVMGSSGTLTATTTIAGRLGQALRFDGTDDYINLGTGSSVKGLTTYTIAGWFYVDTMPANGSSYSLYWESAGNENAVRINAMIENANATYANVANSFTFRYRDTDGSSAVNVNTGANTISAGRWYHLVAVYDSVGDTEKVYLNNVLMISASNVAGTISDTTPFNSNKIGVSGAPDAGENFKGKIDDVRVYNRALSSDEVKRLYHLGATSHISTTIRTNPTLKTGLVGHWTFDGKDTTTRIDDVSGNSNNGGLVLGASGNTATTTVPGRIGQAMAFDGTNDYVSVADNATIKFGSGDFTVGFWTKTTQISPNNATFPVLVSKEDEIATRQGWSFFTDNAGGQAMDAVANRLGFEVKGSGGSGIAKSGITINDAKWHNIVGTRSGTVTTIYVDGVSKGASTASGSTDKAIALTIGNRPTAGNRAFSGTIDDVRIYNRALSSDEVKRLYNLGATSHISTTIRTNPTLTTGLVGHWTFDGKDTTTRIDDVSGNSNNGGLVLGASGNTATTTVPGRIGQAMAFDGTNDYVTLPNNASLNITGPITMSAWIKTSFSGAYQYVISGLTGGSPYAGYGLTISPDNKISYWSGAHAAWVDGSSTVNDNKWHHITAVESGTTVRFYKDGVADGTASTQQPNSYSDVRKIGIFTDNSQNPFKGSIDDVRIYNRALSADEIKRLYDLSR